jgi:hypothetical protein
MKTRPVSSRSIFTGEDGKSLKLRKSDEVYGLGVGDRVSTESGVFEIQHGYEHWNLVPVGATVTDLFMDAPPITRENWQEKRESLSPVNRLNLARELGLVTAKKSQ